MAVDDPLVALALGKGLHAGQVGPRAGLAEALAPDILPRKQPRQQPLLELIGGVVEHRGGGHPQADDIGKIGRASGEHFLVGDPLAVLAAAPADLDGVVAAHQAGVVSRFLPGLQVGQLLVRHDLQGGQRQSHTGVRRPVGRQPIAAVLAEFSLFWAVLAGAC